jgi:hypothetical protein
MRLRWRRRTLVELLAADIVRSDDLGPDWTAVLLVSCFRQDLAALPAAADVSELAHRGRVRH